MLNNVAAYSAIYLTRPETMVRFRLLKKAQHWEEKRVLAYKEKLLRNILDYAYKHVRYYGSILDPYRRCWNAGSFDWNAFYRIPFLSKDTVKREFSALTSYEAQKLGALENRSGGSTGLPTRHMQDEHFRRMDMANNLLFKYWGGVRIGDNSLFIAADERDYFGLASGRRKYITNMLFNKQYFNLFNLTDSSFTEIVKLIEVRRPAYIQAYTSAAYELARFILRNNIRISPPKMVMCIAGTVYDDMMGTIEEAFRCKAYSRYGSRETGDMAGMCANGVYHEMPFTHHIDIVGKDGRLVEPGQAGEIAVTVLSNCAMPLIRYKIGDMGIWASEPCDCAMPFRSFEKITGRTGEIFKNSKGKIILPEIFIHLVGVVLGRLSDGILRFQIVQVDLKNIEVRLVLREKSSAGFQAELNELKDKIIQVMEDDVAVKVVFPEDIPRLPSGKYCYTLSNVK